MKSPENFGNQPQLIGLMKPLWYPKNLFNYSLVTQAFLWFLFLRNLRRF